MPHGPTLPELLALDSAGLALDDLARTRDWAELDDRVARLRALLHDVGLRPGDHLAMVIGNRVELVELVLAALTAGLWLTPVNWHAKRDEIAYVLADSGARVVFADPEHVAVAQDGAGCR